MAKVCGIPSGEGVAFAFGVFGRRSGGVPIDGLGFEHLLIPIDERDGVGQNLHQGGDGGVVRDLVAFQFVVLEVPFVEHIAFVRRDGEVQLGAAFYGIGIDSAFDQVDRTMVADEGQLVGIEFVISGVGLIVHHFLRRYLFFCQGLVSGRLPAFEGIAIPCERRFIGHIDEIDHVGVIDIERLQLCAVPVFEPHRVGIHLILGIDIEVGGDDIILGRPIEEMVSCMLGRFGRSGSGTVVDRFGLEDDRGVHVAEGDGVGIDGIGGRDGEIRLHIVELLIPSGEVVPFACGVSRRRGGFAFGHFFGF